MTLTRLAALFLFGLSLAARVSAAPLAYVPGSTGAELSVIDTDVDAVVATIPVGPYIQGVAISPDGRTVYLSSINGYVFVLDALTNQIVTTIR
jgi:DNA-binding beta-propeller fold protein YncE